MYYFYYQLILWKTCKLAPRLSVSSMLNKVVLFLKCRNEIEDKSSRETLKEAHEFKIWWYLKVEVSASDTVHTLLTAGKISCRLSENNDVRQMLGYSITFEFSTQQRQFHDKITCEALDHILKDQKYKCLYR